MKNNIKKFREDQGKSDQWLADEIGSSRGYIWKVENPEDGNGIANVGTKLGKLIAKALNKEYLEVFPDEHI